MPATATHTHTPKSNPYGLPAGEPIRRELVRCLRAQRAQILAWVAGPHKSIKAHEGLPEAGDLPEFALGDLAMAGRMTPTLTPYWHRSGRALRARLRLDPDAWRVTNPHTSRAIFTSALAFSESTNATTRLNLREALRRTRGQLHAGLVTTGESVPLLTRRVKSVFAAAETWRARRIAQSEASRAVHAAQEAAAVETHMVAGWEWLASPDCCPICATVARRARFVPTGRPFAVIGDHPAYREIRHPPAHPSCNCSANPVLRPEFSGEPAPTWAPTLDQPRPEARDYPGGEPPKPREKPPAPAAPGPGGTTPGKVALAVGKWVAVSAAVSAGTTAATSLAGAAVAPFIPRLTEGALWALLPGAAVAGPRGPASWPRVDGILPGHPIGARVAAYLATDQGRGRLAALASIPRRYWQLRNDLAVAQETARLLKDQIPRGARPTDLAVEIADHARAAADAAAEALERHMTDVRRRVAETIGVRANDAVTLDAPIPAGKSFAPLRDAATHAREFLAEVLATEPASPRPLKIRFAMAPRATLRAWYWRAKQKLMMTATDGVKEVAHELGHLVEAQWPDVGKKAVEFLEYRTGEETPRTLMNLFPGRGYGPDERGRKDRFDQAFPVEEAWYTGMDYKVRKVHTDHYPTEILSKGLEMLLRDPAAFAGRDPEYCGFVLGILDGGLRDPAGTRPPKPAGGAWWDERLWRWINTPFPDSSPMAQPKPPPVPVDLAPHFETARAAVAEVHGDLGLPAAGMRPNPKLKKDGEYIGVRGVSGGTIEVNPNRPHPAYVAVHEHGHYVDHQGLGTAGYGLASEDGLIEPVMKAIHAAAETKALLRAAKTYKAPLLANVRYAAKPSELFARAYAQYVATKTKHVDLMAGLASDRRGIFGTMSTWSEASFSLISKEFDALFASRKP